MNDTIAEIRMFAGNFAPKNWAFCAGQILSIAQNQALFSILGTTYGGNGVTTFALPDLRSRVAIGAGQGPGLPNVVLGQAAGSPAVTLTMSEMPAHNHIAVSNNTTGGGTAVAPTNNVWAGSHVPTGGSPVDTPFSNGAPNTIMNPNAIAPAGGNQPHENMQPYLGMNYIICLYGIFPSRN